MDIYRELILDHYRHPRNWGRLEHPTAEAGDNLVSCGDNLDVGIVSKKGKICKIRFRGQGCALSIAAASLLSQHVEGKTLTEVQKLGRPDMEKLLGMKLGISRIKCALLSLAVLQKAVNSLK